MKTCKTPAPGKLWESKTHKAGAVDRDCIGRVIEIQIKTYSLSILTQLQKENKFSHSPILPLLLRSISSQLAHVSLIGKYDSFDKTFQNF